MPCHGHKIFKINQSNPKIPQYLFFANLKLKSRHEVQNLYERPLQLQIRIKSKTPPRITAWNSSKALLWLTNGSPKSSPRENVKFKASRASTEQFLSSQRTTTVVPSIRRVFNDEKCHCRVQHVLVEKLRWLSTTCWGDDEKSTGERAFLCCGVLIVF